MRRNGVSTDFEEPLWSLSARTAAKLDRLKNVRRSIELARVVFIFSDDRRNSHEAPPPLVGRYKRCKAGSDFVRRSPDGIPQPRRTFQAARASSQLVR